MLPAILLFAATYVLMLTFSRYRPYIALTSGVIFIITGMLPLGDIIPSLDFNVLLMIGGTMGLVQLFIDSHMPERLADMIMAKVPTVQWAAVCLSLFAGVISAFVDNVATVLMVAPVALEICKKLKTNPIPVLIAIAVSSNLQGAATLVGDTTAIMLGSALNMSFMDFFWYYGKPSMFFAVELGAVLSACIVYWIFRKEKGSIPKTGKMTEVSDYVPTIYNYAKKKSLAAVIDPLKAIDFETLGLLVGLFLMIGGISNMGVIDALAALLAQLGGGNVFLMFTIIVWASVLISAFIDNIPYVATMIPVIGGIAAQMAPGLGVDATLVGIPLYFGLLSGATLGGNITPIGASANITAIGILRREGYEVANSDFFKIGIPFTLSAVIPAYIYIWLVYGV